MSNQLLYPIEEAARILGVGRTTVYYLIQKGELRTVHIGRRALVPADELRAYVKMMVDTEDPA